MLKYAPTVKLSAAYLADLKYAGSTSTLPYFPTSSHIYDGLRNELRPAYGSFEPKNVAAANEKTFKIMSLNVLSPEITANDSTRPSYDCEGKINLYEGSEHTPARVEQIIAKIDEVSSQGNVMLTLQEFSFSLRTDPRLIEVLGKKWLWHDQYGLWNFTTQKSTRSWISRGCNTVSRRPLPAD